MQFECLFRQLMNVDSYACSSLDEFRTRDTKNPPKVLSCEA